MRTGIGWSAVPGEVAGTLVQRGPGPPTAPLAAPQVAEASEVPATPASSSRLRRRPVYYLSEVLSTSKQNYPHYQKMCYGIYYATKKLKPYFQEHPITVVCTAPLAEIIGSRDASGRVAKWAIALAP